jgi:hypothetical protein
LFGAAESRAWRLRSAWIVPRLDATPPLADESVARGAEPSSAQSAAATTAITRWERRTRLAGNDIAGMGDASGRDPTGAGCDMAHVFSDFAEIGRRSAISPR